MNSKIKDNIVFVGEILFMLMLVIIIIIIVSDGVSEITAKDKTVNPLYIDNIYGILENYAATGLNCTTYGIIRLSNETCMVCTTITATYQHRNSTRWKNEKNNTVNIDNSSVIRFCEPDNRSSN